MEHLIEIYRDFYLFDFSSNWIFLISLGLIILDVILGNFVALINKTFSTKESKEGIFRNITSIIVLLLAFPAFVDFGISEPIQGMLIILVASKALGVIKKWEQLGGYVPDRIKTFLNNIDKKPPQ